MKIAKLMFCTLILLNSSLSTAMEKPTPYLLTDSNLPTDVWGVIAEKLPGNDKFLKYMARFIPLTQVSYEEMAQALIDEVADQPFADEVEAWLARYFQTSFFNVPLKENMRKAFAKFIAKHPTDADGITPIPFQNLAWESFRNMETALEKQQSPENSKELKELSKKARLVLKLGKRELAKMEKPNLMTYIKEYAHKFFIGHNPIGDPAWRPIFLALALYNLVDMSLFTYMFGPMLTFKNPRTYLHMLALPPTLIEFGSLNLYHKPSRFSNTSTAMAVTFGLLYGYHKITAPKAHSSFPITLPRQLEQLEHLLQQSYDVRKKFGKTQASL